MKDKNLPKPAQKHQSWFQALLISVGIGFSGYASAASNPQSIGQIATNVIGSFGEIAQLITAGAYIAGMGFALGAILKFKQHKDNPQQIPIGTPIALLFIAAALIFLPTIFGVAGQTVFGSGVTSGGPGGVSTF